MATAEELLSGSISQDKTFVVDNDLRTIIIPKSVPVLGVESDDDVNRVEFRMPATYCGIDLSVFEIKINYLNANAEPDVYEVTDAVKRADGVIKFSWLVGRHAAMYKGDVKFNVCMKDVDSDGKVNREFNTTIATLPILEGLETGEQAIVEYNDIFEQWKASLFGEGDSAVQMIKTAETSALMQISAARDDAVSAIPADYTATAEAADEGVRTKADAIVQTVHGRNIRIDDSSDDYLRGLRLFGASKQTTTTGKNLLNVGESTTLDNVRGISTNLPAGSYVVSLTEETHSGDQPPYLRFYDNGVWIQLKSNFAQTAVLSKPESTVYLYTYGMSAAESVGVSATLNQLMVSATGGEYEPYSGGVASPSPEWPAPIDHVEPGATRVYGEDPNVAPSLVRYASPTEHTYLAGLPVNSGGNYTDENGQQWLCDEVDCARGVHIQRVVSKTLNGSIMYQEAGTQVDGTYTAFVRYSDVWINNEDTFISDGFVCYPASEYKTSAKEGVYNNPGDSVNLDLIIVRLSNEHATDMTSFVDFMTAHPVTVLAPLKTPIETPMPTAPTIATFKAARTVYPVTSVTNAGGAFMEVAYNADIESYIDKRLTASGGRAARISYAYLPASGWQGAASPYYQVVDIPGTTKNSQVDLTPSVEQLSIFHNKDLAFVTENENGVVTVYAIGQKPTNDYTIQVTLMEVVR